MKLIQSLSDLPNLSGVNHLLFDTEGSGLSPYHGDRISGLCIAQYESEEEFYIPVRQRLYPNEQTGTNQFVNLPAENVFRWFNDLAKDPAKRWFGHNLKFDINMLRFENIELVGDLLDTLPLAHVHNGDEYNYEMDTLTRNYVPGFNHEWMLEKEAWLGANTPRITSEEGKSSYNYSLLPMNLIANYGCEDIRASRGLTQYYLAKPLWDRIPNQGYPAWTAKELIQNEMRLVKSIARMEFNGAQMDMQQCRYLRDKANDEIEQLLSQMFKIVGRSFATSAWTDMWKAFEQAGGRVIFWSKKEKKGKQKSQQFTTKPSEGNGRPCFNSVAIMRYLEIFKKENNARAYEFMRLYREVSQRERLVSTNLDVYLKKADANGIVHGQFHQHRTVTGRLSSSDPNEQNVTVIKGNADLKALEGIVGKDDEALSRQLRKLFIAEPGCVLCSNDWSQVEYRCAAFLANDPILLDRYRKDPTTDYHQATSEIVGISRDLAKTVNFLSLYGGGPSALSAKLTDSGYPTSIDEAKAILNKLFEKRPALKNLITNMSDWAKKKGYIQNQFGRRCYIPHGLEYIATNYADQGACGDAMRNAIVRIDEYITTNKLPVKMTLTVHDELCYQIPKEYAAELAPDLARVMCIVPQFGIPLLSDVELGKNWGELKALKDWVAAQAA